MSQLPLPPSTQVSTKIVANASPQQPFPEEIQLGLSALSALGTGYSVQFLDHNLRKLVCENIEQCKMVFLGEQCWQPEPNQDAFKEFLQDPKKFNPKKYRVNCHQAICMILLLALNIAAPEKYKPIQSHLLDQYGDDLTADTLRLLGQRSNKAPSKREHHISVGTVVWMYGDSHVALCVGEDQFFSAPLASLWTGPEGNRFLQITKMPQLVEEMKSDTRVYLAAVLRGLNDLEQRGQKISDTVYDEIRNPDLKKFPTVDKIDDFLKINNIDPTDLNFFRFSELSPENMVGFNLK